MKGLKNIMLFAAILAMVTAMAFGAAAPAKACDDLGVSYSTGYSYAPVYDNSTAVVRFGNAAFRDDVVFLAQPVSHHHGNRNFNNRNFRGNRGGDTIIIQQNRRRGRTVISF